MMSTKVYPAAVLSGKYDLRPLEKLHLNGAHTADVGLVRIGEGTRSPPEGFRAGAKHEIGYLVAGRVRIDTADGSKIVNAGDVAVLSPAEPHATTALLDAVIFYAAIDAASS